jgi:hypothetical protein
MYMKDSDLINIERTQLYQQLFLYGDFVPLKFKIDLELFNYQILSFKDDWVLYNKHKGDTGRFGLSITSLDGGMSGEPDLQSIYEYSKITGNFFSENQFNQPTKAFKKLTCLHELLYHFEGGLGRCRIVKFRPGGFFPPHRDGSVQFQVPDYFRIFVPLNNTGSNQLYFIYENKKIFYEPGRAYLFNALKTHSVFSFTNDAHTFAMSLSLNQLNIKNAIDALEVR